MAPDERHDIPYDARFGTRTLLDVYLPEGGGARRPTVLMIHGGAWKFGSKEMHAGEAQRLARSGYVAVSINYRLAGAGVFPRSFHDCQCALAFIRAHADEYGIDPDRILTTGYSAGGHLASLLGVAAGHPELAPDCEAAAGGPVAPPAGVFSGAGPQDLRTMWQADHRMADYLGGSPAEIPHAYDLASPIAHVAAGEPPFFIVSDAGIGVEREASARMRDSLVAAGNDARMLAVSGGWHVFAQRADPGLVDVGVTTQTPESWIAFQDFIARVIGTP